MGIRCQRTTEMRRRILDVTAYTTLNFVDASAYGGDWSEDAPAVVDVDVPDEESPEVVELDIELDGKELDRVPPHADRLSLSPTQARTLADDLREYADRVDGES
jgi:hypothetical protein